MTTKFLRLTPLKEEYNSEEEEDQPESRKVSPFKGRRLSIEEIPNNELNINLNNSNENNLKHSFKSPRKNRKTAKIISQRIIMNKNTSSKVDLCLYALAHQPNKRNQEMINYIKSYLKSMPSFMNVISKEQNVNLSENLIEQISIHLRHEFIPRNNLVCRYGDRGDKFYIILKGKVTFLVPKMIKCYLNLEEYINYLMQLRKNDEFELINNLLVQNRSCYPIEDDNLDEYLINEYDEYQRYIYKASRKKNKSKTGKNAFNSNFNFKSINNERKSIVNNSNNNNNNNTNNNDYDLNTNLKLNKIEERANKKRITMGVVPSMNRLGNHSNKNDESKKNYFSFQTYKKMGLLIDKIRQHKNSINLNLTDGGVVENNIIGENSPKTYLKSNNIINRDLEPKGRKLITAYHYEEMNTFENGQTFGFIALVNKTCKRASTAIVTEDCDLGVLTKDEYLQFFELLSMKEKKNLYDLLHFYNLIISISEHKFIKKYYHMFEFKKYYKNHLILDIHKPIKERIIFSQGLFIIFINVNIPELNDLITKIKIIKGKTLGLSKYKIERTLDEKRENQDLLIRKKYMSEKESKILLKKYNYTLSIISDHLILGNVDTVDPQTHLPLFNCICNSAECDGYSITNKSIKIINEENIVIHDLTEFCLMKMEYNLTRLKQFKKEILSKIKENEISELKEQQEQINNDINNDNFNNNNINTVSINAKNNDINYDKNDINLYNNKVNYINRNELDASKNINNNKKKLLSNRINKDKIEKAKNMILKTKNEEMKNTLEKNIKKSYNIYRNKLNILTPFNSELTQKENLTIKKLKESIIKKQKKIEMKTEENNNNINPNTNHIKHSLSSESFNKITKGQNKTRNNQSLKKIKYKSVNIFKHYLKNIDKINLLNNQLLALLLAKNKLNILPNIQSGYKKLKNFFKENQIKIENDNKINTLKKKYEKNITDDLYKIDQFSFVKEKFIVFKSNKRPFQEIFNTVNYDSLPKINRNNQIHPIRLKKQFFNGISNDNNKNNNDNKNKDSEDKTNNYTNTNSSLSKMSIKQSMKEKNINDKYNELNILLNNMQNITKKILSKKV